MPTDETTEAYRRGYKETMRFGIMLNAVILTGAPVLLGLVIWAM